jgi:signal transduction histidine kinase
MGDHQFDFASQVREQFSMNRAGSVRNFLSVIMASPKWLALLTTLVLVGLIGWLDYVTGWEWDASTFYALPITLIVFRTDRRLGFAVAMLCAATWCLAQFDSHPYQTSWGFALAVVSVSFYFAVVVVAVAAVKAQWELGRSRIAMLEHTRRLENDIHHASEQEQQRIGQELHDGLCQTLAGIAALSATLSRTLVAKSDAGASAAAAEITKLLNGAIGEARDLAHGLDSVGQHEINLPAALEHLAVNVQHRFRVSCGLKCDGTFSGLGGEVVGHLQRIAQEALNNAVAHGRVQRIEICLSGANGEGLLSVRDDGVGIPERALQGDGMGLDTMAYRARLIGGSLEVQRVAPHGTAVTCAFPLSETRDNREILDHACSDD